MAEVSKLQGIIEVLGADPSVAALLRVSQAFDTAAASAANAQKTAAGFTVVGQATQTAAASTSAVASANQQYIASTRARVSLDDQLEKQQLRLRLAQSDAAARVTLLRQEYERLAAAARPLVLSQDEITRRTIAATQAATQLANAEKTLAREEAARAQAQAQAAASSLTAAAGGIGRGVVQATGLGSVLTGVGVAGGATILTRQLIEAGQQATELAVRAETIGTAFEASTKRAGLSSDDLLSKLNQAARGTASDVDLMAASNKALALGVGQNAQQIADLLAIARQKGKDFGEGTAQAFEDITTGLGRLSPRILDNLGIILDENKVYKEYAVSIGVAEGKLSDQEKRQALVNELLRTNTDLISKNATAQLDAADKITAAQVRAEEAKTRAGQALLPGRVALAEGGAGVADLLAGNLSLRDLAAGFEQAARSGQGLTNLSTVIEALSVAEQHATDAAKERTDAQERLAAVDAKVAREDGNAAAAAKQVSDAYAVTTESVKAWGNALSIETDRALRPYKAAVDATKDSLDAHKQSTTDAKDEVSRLSTELDTAKKQLKELADTQLAGTQAYKDAIFDLDQQLAQAERNKILFETPGGPLDQLLAPIQKQIDDTAASLPGLKRNLDEAQSAFDDQQKTVDGATRELKQHEQAVSAAKTAYDSLKQTISDNTSELERLRSASLTGTGAFESQLDGLNDRATALQLRLTNMKLSGAPESSLKALEAQIERVNLQSQRTKLQENLALDPLRRQIQDFGKAGELTFDQIISGMQAAQGNIDAAKQQLGPAKTALDQETKARDDAQKAVDREKASLDTLNESLKVAKDAYDDQTKKLSALKTQLDDTRKNAVKPFEDAVKSLGDRAQVLKLAEKLELDPLKKKIEETAKPIKEMTFAEIIDGLHKTNDQIDTLTPKLDKAKGLLADEEAATKEAQKHYDAAQKALEQQQKYFDNLKQGLNDLKANLTESKNIWGDLQTLIGAISQANAGMGTGSAYNGQPTGGPSGGTYNAQSINRVIPAASPLQGQGQFIIQMALKYGIPVEIALAMWQVEGQYATAGAAATNLNPGNLRSSPLEAGERGGFAYFNDIQSGIEAYFQLLNSPLYRNFVSSYKAGNINSLRDLIAKYAPASDNNNPDAYYNSVIKLIQSLLAQIRGGRMTTATGTIGNATTADDPRPDAGALQSLFGPTAHLGDTYDATRPGTTGTHQGLDIQITPNTPFGAPVALHITAVYPDQFFVNTTVVGTDMYGRQWLFAHLIRVPVKIGDHVPKGGILGYVAANARHVHVQLRQRDDTSTPIDPSQALNDAATGYGAQSLAVDTGGGGPDSFSGQPVGGYTMLQSGAAGSNPLADAQAVFAFVQVGIETLGQLKRYHGVSREAVQLFSNDVAGFVATFTAAVAGFDRDAMGAALQWVTASGAVLASVGTGIDDLTAISRYKGVSRNAVLQFGNDLYATVETLTTIVRDFDRAGMAAAVTWQENAGQVLAIVGAGVDSLTAISKYKGVSPKTVWDFAHDVKEVVWALTSIEKDFDPDAVQAATDWATNAGTVLTTLATAFDSFKQLGKYKGVTQAQVWTLEHDIKESVYAMVAISSDMDPDAVQAAAAFAATSGQVLTVFGGAIDAFTKLADYHGVAPEAIQQIENDITGAVGLMTVLAQKLDKEGVQAAADFADSAGRVIAPIGAAVDIFTKLRDYKGVLPEAIKLIESDITGAVGTMIEMDRVLDEDGLQAATDVASKEQTIFEALGAGLSFFTNVEDYKGKGPEKVQALLDDIAHVNEMTGALSYQAGAAESGANDFEGHLQSYASHIRSALNSIRALDGLRADATIHAATHVVTDGAGGGTDGNANGGNGNNPDVPDLGYQPPSNSSGSGMASGGPVAAGVSYTVGEFGRETFTPWAPGFITPHHEVSSGDTHLHFDFTGTNFGGATPAQIRGIVAEAVDVAMARRDANHLSIGRSKGR